MLIAHVLMMLIPGLPTAVSTGQIFASEAACEVARAAMAANDPVNQYTCLASPESTPNR
ncbi:MAG: hypothetical protein HOI97_04490 [Oceanospirillales bacterium]|jgi:hypothetical protein|nr:hypothetical protein [Litorivicinus sp.]MBT6287808.1 hypothetical protein [Oceanospirillales bacterium]MDA0893354.1 hypothetical protein [Pseudomonadota bacterium]MDA8665302.1 hypothetical protein [Litorivicinaceae bacterium]MBL6824931.1 hypothetical protein [Litorivicinus sp.]